VISEDLTGGPAHALNGKTHERIEKIRKKTPTIEIFEIFIIHLPSRS
jgi:hypothetical protein